MYDFRLAVKRHSVLRCQWRALAWSRRRLEFNLYTVIQQSPLHPLAFELDYLCYFLNFALFFQPVVKRKLATLNNVYVRVDRPCGAETLGAEKLLLRRSLRVLPLCNDDFPESASRDESLAHQCEFRRSSAKLASEWLVSPVARGMSSSPNFCARGESNAAKKSAGGPSSCQESSHCGVETGLTEFFGS